MTGALYLTVRGNGTAAAPKVPPGLCSICRPRQRTLVPQFIFLDSQTLCFRAAGAPHQLPKQLGHWARNPNPYPYWLSDPYCVQTVRGVGRPQRALGPRAILLACSLWPMSFRQVGAEGRKLISQVPQKQESGSGRQVATSRALAPKGLSYGHVLAVYRSE